MAEERCMAAVFYKASTGKCGYPVKSNGLCTIHLQLKEKQEKEDERIRAERAARAEQFAELKEIAAGLTRAVGTQFKLTVDANGYYRIGLPRDFDAKAVRKAIEALEGKKG